MINKSFRLLAEPHEVLQINVEWMHENNVVKNLLRANLHQKQYVDQVRTG